MSLESQLSSDNERDVRRNSPSSEATDLTQPQAGPLVSPQSLPDLPPQQRQHAAMQIQRTHGNAYLQRQLNENPPVQRQEAQWQREMREEGTIINLPEAYNWDFAAPIEVNELATWNEGVTFQDFRFARHLGQPFIQNHAIPHMHRMQDAFRTKWTQFQGHWNQIGALARSLDITGIPAPAGDASAAPRTTDTGSDATQPRGEQGPSVSQLFQENPGSAGAQLAMSTTMDPQRLPPAQRDRYHALMLAAHSKSGATRQQVNNVDTALSNVRSAAMGVDISQLRIDSAEHGVDQAGLGVQQGQVTAERDRVAAALAIIKDLGSMAIAIHAGKPDAAWSSGAGAVSNIVLNQYNERLRRIDAQMRQITQSVAIIGRQIAVIEFNRSLEAVRVAQNALSNAIIELSTKVAEEAEAYRQFADFIEANGQAMGLSAADARTATSAAAALPLIEDTIRQYQQVIDAMQNPEFTRESGVGIQMAPSNLGSFVVHVAQFKGYRQVLQRGKADWEGRRGAARSGLGMPAAPTTR